ncbi:ribosomal protection-like ABC-F family protein [Listeria costaricensis]|uniref:ribosomal protection-like ABC-F family protein n=1 Tax=Listeria costaricensis TaxID=2026604 RepID=UPI000C06B426|nr:ABC-F family ATP-binding cassette domain-containing protein [Listeria costaricensis]
MFSIEIEQVKKELGTRTLFQIPKLTAGTRARIGLVGRNGVGKTTLFEILAGIKEPDQGEIRRKGSTGYIRQLSPEDDRLSGGEKTRKWIKAEMRQRPALLFADEPTSNLDVESVRHLERQFKKYSGAVFLISHDRAFLNEVVDTIWELENEIITVYPGNYDAYLAAKAKQHEKAAQAYSERQAKKSQLEEAIRHREKEAGKQVRPSKRLTSKEIRSAKPSKGVQQKKQHKLIKAIEKRIDRLETVEKPYQFKAVKITIPKERMLKPGSAVLTAQALTLQAGEKVLFQTKGFTLRAGEKVVLSGVNASGKTSLLRAIIGEDSALRLSPDVTIGYFDQELRNLDKAATVLENIQKANVHEDKVALDVLGSLHFDQEDWQKPVQVLSGGERVKLSLAMLLTQGANFLILDEPTNYLDIEALEALEQMIASYEGAVLFVSHDRMFTEKVAEKMLLIEEKELRLIDQPPDVYKKEKEEPQVEEDKLLLTLRQSEIAAKLMEPQLSEAEKKALDEEYFEIVRKLKHI